MVIVGSHFLKFTGSDNTIFETLNVNSESYIDILRLIFIITIKFIRLHPEAVYPFLSMNLNMLGPHSMLFAKKHVLLVFVE